MAGRPYSPDEEQYLRALVRDAPSELSAMDLARDFQKQYPHRSVNAARCKIDELRNEPAAKDESPAVQEWAARRDAAFREAQAYIPRKGAIAKLFKDHPDLDERTAEQILADIRAEREQPEIVKPRLRYAPDDERHMLEVDIFDAHVGKLAWREETGENYDSNIARDRVSAAVDDLLRMAEPYALDGILLPWGNDLLHYDSLSGQTTAGTPQDRDSRYQLMYRRAFWLGVWTIQRCAEKAPVKVIIVPGNHDAVSTFTQGVALEAYFHADPRVTVENTARPRKYHPYGSVLLGFCHGQNEPHKRLTGLMPVEVPELWSASKYREFHVGHLHKSKVTEPIKVDGENGVRVRILQSLSGTDAFHATMGYVGEPHAAEAFVWSYTRGLRANLISSL